MISARRAALLGLKTPLSAIMLAVLGLLPEEEEEPPPQTGGGFVRRRRKPYVPPNIYLPFFDYLPRDEEDAVMLCGLI